ncbi:hypothetical protein I3843_03G028700 [Carya illinoinensis]|uniref:Transmembrane protein n=1 Tax=Carya illinoinensis TaxID=32201 RepID=A0A922FGS0_CARIL|nr:hypothetical protein I3760_03G025600 [Carya illinoinensis]KAG6719837.1 hypothetical protein I3842_03G027200 [Carya illinoinensis]KAG7985497.1 hypothetical protein I3843_03G028700 [Carya illinoinensis]
MEMRKINSHKRVTEERDREDDDIMNTVLYTAGAALLMACVKRAMITCLVEQYWRAWVFLALNLVLLAIVFTSLRSASNENQECNDDQAEMKIERNKNERRCTGSAQAEDHCGHKVHRKKSDESEVDGVDPDEDQAGEAPMRLSKEELNERVETFIAMFRQHLVSDAKKGRSQFFVKPARAEVLKFQKVSYMTLSPRGSCA